jgi:hypothetical protein
VFFVVIRVEEKLLNGTMQRGQALRSLCVWEVYVHVGPWGYNVEFGIEHIDAIHNTIETRHGESSMALILPYRVLTAKKKNHTVKKIICSTSNPGFLAS